MTDLPVVELSKCEYDKTRKVPQRGHWLVKTGKTEGIFKIKVVAGIRFNKGASQGGLAALARAKKGCYSATAKCRLYCIVRCWSVYHTNKIP